MRDALWQLLVRPEAVMIKVPALPGPSRHRALGRLRELPKGAAVVLVDGAPLSNGRCRRFARAAGVEIERQYLVLPSLRSAVYLVEDAAESIRYLRDATLAAPPATPFISAAASCALWMARRLMPDGLMGAFMLGRVVTGCRR